jgi:hypothetical protein
MQKNFSVYAIAHLAVSVEAKNESEATTKGEQKINQLLAQLITAGLECTELNDIESIEV